MVQQERIYRAGNFVFSVVLLAGFTYSAISMGVLCYRSLFPRQESPAVVSREFPTTQPIRPTTQSFLEEQTNRS